jgi:transcriptional regulator with XRE-family HTH domain
MIGEEIRRRRREKGLTGVQLAAKAGMAPSAISQIETGRRSPHSASVMKLAAALECEVADLYPKAPQVPLPLELHPPGEAYFVPPEEGEEPDIVTLRLYLWHELEKDDPLVQKVAKLVKDERLASPDTITISTQELYEMMRRVWNHEREPDAALMELGAA